MGAYEARSAYHHSEVTISFDHALVSSHPVIMTP